MEWEFTILLDNWFDLLFVPRLLTVFGFTDIFVDVLVRLLERRMDSEFEPHTHTDYARKRCFSVQAFEEQLQEAVTHCCLTPNKD